MKVYGDIQVSYTRCNVVHLRNLYILHAVSDTHRCLTREGTMSHTFQTNITQNAGLPYLVANSGRTFEGVITLKQSLSAHVCTCVNGPYTRRFSNHKLRVPENKRLEKIYLLLASFKEKMYIKYHSIMVNFLLKFYAYGNCLIEAIQC